MGYPGVYAERKPDHPAVIMAGTGETLTYRELDQRSNQFAHLLRAQGLQTGDHVALFMENQIRYMEILWGCLRSGLYVTAINSFLTAEEVTYIVDDCDAQVVVSSRSRSEHAARIDPAATPKVQRWLMTDGTVADAGGPAWESYEDVMGAQPTSRIADEQPGFYMLYSSGTTSTKTWCTCHRRRCITPPRWRFPRPFIERVAPS